MSDKKFKFVSPGIFINEIDNSQLPAAAGPMGPVIIGRTERGPSLRPVQVNSFSDFVEVFGNPLPGGRGGDVWRDGNNTAPTYAAYAAQAWLRNNSPATIVRLLGREHTDRVASTGRAGWATENSSAEPSIPNPTAAANGGAFGLFIIEGPHATGGPTADGHRGLYNGVTHKTGALGAIFYLNDGKIILTGSSTDGGNAGGAGIWIKSVDTGIAFTAEITNGAGSTTTKRTFNFSETSPNYIRKVFNTNPTLTNSYVSEDSPLTSYWLGETYDGHLKQYVTGTVTGESYATILPLSNGTIYGSDLRKPTQASKTGWFISQDLASDNHSAYDAEDMQQLFRFVSLETGEWDQKNLKISITNIKASTNTENPYGTFSVLIRRMEDTDSAVRVIERYSNCDLNPHSDNYICKKIGDKYLTWQDSDRRYVEYGNYTNRSQFVRVEVDESVDKGNANPEYLPFGFKAPLRFKGFSFSGSFGPRDISNFTVAESNTFVSSSSNSAGAFTQNSWFSTRSVGGSFILSHTGSDLNGVNPQPTAFKNENFFGAIKFPQVRMRVNTREGNVSNPQNAFFGVDPTYNTLKYDKSTPDVLRAKPYGVNDFAEASSGLTEFSYVFSLDDVKLEDATADTTAGAPTGSHARWNEGNRAAGTSLTSQSGSYTEASWKNVLSKGFDRFTTVLHGGFDGMDITEREPFRNTYLGEANASETTNYAFNSIKMAIDCVSDPEVVEFDTLLCPGLTNSTLNSHMIKTCEERGDSLAIVDLAGGYKPDTESTDSESARLGSVDTTIDNLLGYGWNSSYACTYYPWVQIRDNINGSTLWCPPSVAALGAMSSGQSSSELWFAPAGFTRGGLTDGAAGIPVIGVRQRLTSKERDKLYDANINPIATFPAEGIVIFGQKTLQVTPSALDRVNVRRLLIYLKKQISRMAATILFDQNAQVTWNRFRGQVEPFLATVKARLGLTDYKVVLDRTTTTQDLVDRNIMYAKIFLKPAQAIEYIALDFVITDSGASFED